MKPGVVYTADDGSTIELQILIEERQLDVFSPFVLSLPDRMRDVRLFMTVPGGQCAALHLHSVARPEVDTLMTMYGNIRPPLHAKNGIVNDRHEWSGPLAGAQ